MKKQNISRRQFIGTGAIAATGMLLLSKASFAASVLRDAGKPNSVINGVQIGVITYSFRSMPGTAEDLLKYCIDCNINAIELMGDAAEAYAGHLNVLPTKVGPILHPNWPNGAPV